MAVLRSKDRLRLQSGRNTSVSFAKRIRLKYAGAVTPAGKIAKAITPLSAESTKAEQKGNWMHSIQRLSAQAGKTQ